MITGPLTEEALAGLNAQQLEDELEAARQRVTETRELEARYEQEVRLVHERLLHQQLEQALAEGGAVGALRWWTQGQRTRDDQSHARTAMSRWVRGALASRARVWLYDHCPSRYDVVKKGRVVGAFNIAWRVSPDPTYELAALARSLNFLGDALRAAELAGQGLPQLRIQVCPPRTGMYFDDHVPDPCLTLRLTPSGWDLTTDAGAPITIATGGANCQPLLAQAQTIAQAAQSR
ncbi:hypothetical protein ACFYZ9_28975 [Streptomyces sp. NPDC001691]|uniref:hypothetical protein n=1 Tax=Streptomyces sp. NPDC001691 TaxID=3364600 RepID=UPI0036C7F01C